LEGSVLEEPKRLFDELPVILENATVAGAFGKIMSSAFGRDHDVVVAAAEADSDIRISSILSFASGQLNR